MTKASFTLNSNYLNKEIPPIKSDETLSSDLKHLFIPDRTLVHRDISEHLIIDPREKGKEWFDFNQYLDSLPYGMRLNVVLYLEHFENALEQTDLNGNIIKDKLNDLFLRENYINNSIRKSFIIRIDNIIEKLDNYLDLEIKELKFLFEAIYFSIIYDIDWPFLYPDDIRSYFADCAYQEMETLEQIKNKISKETKKRLENIICMLKEASVSPKTFTQEIEEKYIEEMRMIIVEIEEGEE